MSDTRENVNFRVDGDVLGELRSEADERGYGSLSAYLRAIIRSRHEGHEDVDRRLDEHEARLKTLEAAVAELRDGEE